MAIEAYVREFFALYAYKPLYVYGGVFGFMYASAFGLPLPEEVVLISAGFLAFMAKHPELAPPPEVGAVGVNARVLSVVALTAVITSDMIIFWLGHKFGRRLLRSRFAANYMPPERLAKLETWSRKYGFWTSGIFRFTPGLRFPGHLFCGMSGVPLWKFLAVDGTAALLTIPPQILLIAHYGDAILKYLREFKLALLAVALVAATIYFARRSRRPPAIG